MENTELLRKKAWEFNRKFFHNRIPVDSLRFEISNRMKKTRGYYRSDGLIKISSMLMVDESEWELTLLHEMVHCYQSYVMAVRPDHGYTFKNIAKKIYQQSQGKYQITRITTICSEKVKATIREQNKQNNGAYLVWNELKRFNFIRSLTPREKEYLKKTGKKIGMLTEGYDPSSIRHCRNLTSLIKARYYYDKETLQRAGLKWKEL